MHLSLLAIPYEEEDYNMGLMFTAETCYACVHSICQCTATLHLTSDRYIYFYYNYFATLQIMRHIQYIKQAIFSYNNNNNNNEIDNDAHIHTLTH